MEFLNGQMRALGETESASPPGYPPELEKRLK